jgi:hypothetical protein
MVHQIKQRAGRYKPVAARFHLILTTKHSARSYRRRLQARLRRSSQPRRI